MTYARTRLASAWAIVVAAAAAALLACLVIPIDAHAAEGGSITIDCRDDYASKDGHAYSAYRLFAGEVHDDQTMSDATTRGCMSASFYDQAGLEGPASEMVVQLASKVQADSDGSYIAELSRIALSTSKTRAAATFGVNQAQPLEAGWYLMISDGAQPFVVLIGSEPVTVTEKSVPPTTSKLIGKDGHGSDSIIAGSWEDVPFELTATLPSNFAAYDAFPCAFDDEASDGLSIDPDSVKVSIRHKGGASEDVASGFEKSLDGGRLRVSFDDLKKVGGVSATDTVAVTYTARVNTKAATGYSDGNPNEMTFEYRRSPSFDGTGKTPPVTARAYTFGLRVTKRDATSQQALPGATFALGRNGKWLGPDGDWHTDVQELFCDGQGHLQVTGIAPGTYTLREVKAPDGYQRAADATVMVDADLDGKTLDVTAVGAAEVTSTDAATGIADVTIDDVPQGTDIDLSHRPSSSKGGQSRDLYHTDSGIAAIAAIAAGSALTIAGVTRRRHERRDDDHVS